MSRHLCLIITCWLLMGNMASAFAGASAMDSIRGATQQSDWDALFLHAETAPLEMRDVIAAYRNNPGTEPQSAEQRILVSLLDSVSALYSGDIALAREQAAVAMAASGESDHLMGLARSKHVLSMVEFFTRNYEAAGALAEEVTDMLEPLTGSIPSPNEGSAEVRDIQTAARRLQAGVLSMLANIDTMRADFVEAGERYLEALRITDDLGDELRGMKLRANLGNLSMMTGNMNRARAYYEEALAFAEKTANTHVMIVTRTNLGGVYQSLGEYERERRTYEEALTMARELGHAVVIPTLLINLSDYHLRSENWHTAHAYSEEAVELSLASGDRSTLAVALVNLGSAVMGMDQPDHAMAYYREAEEIFHEQEARFQLRELYEIMARASARAELFQDAYSYHIKFKEISDSLLGSETAERLEALKADYNVERQEREIAELQQANLSKQLVLQRQALENEHQQSLLELQHLQIREQEALRNVLLIGFFALVIILYSFVRRYTSERKARAELQRLNGELSSREESLQRINGQLIKSMQDKDDLLGVVSHDLKNPISGIQGIVEIIEEDLPDSTPEETREMVGLIRQSADRMFEVVNQLLDNYRHQAQGNRPHERFDAVKICHEAIRIWSERAARKHQQLLFDPPADPLFFSGDDTVLFQVVENLLSNAVKFSPMSGSITLKMEADSASFLIKVIDHGPGIPDSELDQLFQKFHTGRARPTAGEDSTGLGLSIVQRLVASLGGKVWHEPTSPHGATFVVAIPRVHSVEVAADNGESC